MAKSHLEFYLKHEISPVRQDISNLQAHFQRRKALYLHLGIMPANIQGKRVLEVGPGSGFNSLYTASLKPSNYTLVEPNPTGVEHVEKLFCGYPDFQKNLFIEPVVIENYESSTLFDFVFCEGMLPGQPNPTKPLSHLAKLVAPGGALIVTCNDAISVFPEVLRCLLGLLLVDPKSTISEKVSLLAPVFSPHLDTLKGMSRRHDDWVLDNVISSSILSTLFSIPDVISVIKDDFDCYGSSPRFITDWRWYKTIAGEDPDFNKVAIDQYWENAHNLIDYRGIFPSRLKAENHALFEVCSKIIGKVAEFEITREVKLIQEIRENLVSVEEATIGFSEETAKAFKEFREIISDSSVNRAALRESANFASLFGRGQQYLSLVKKV